MFLVVETENFCVLIFGFEVCVVLNFAENLFG